MLKDKIRIFNLICAAAVLVIALLGLAGYLPGMKMLGSIREGYVPMAPATAACFIVTGIVMFFLTAERLSSPVSSILFFLNFAVILFAVLEVAGFIAGADLNFEEALVPAAGFVNGFPAARMSPVTGFSFFLSSSAAFCILLQRKKPVQDKVLEYIEGWLGLALLLLSYAFFLGYINGTPFLYGSKETIPMALTTTIGFMFSSLFLVTVKKDAFPLNLFTGSSTRSYLLRFILPLTVLPLSSGEILYHYLLEVVKVNPAVMQTGFVVLVTALIGFTATMVSRHISSVLDSQNEVIRQTSRALGKSEKQYRTLFETMRQGVVYQNHRGEVLSANPAVKSILGLSLDQIQGRRSLPEGWHIVNIQKKPLPEEEYPPMVALSTGNAVEDSVLGVFNPASENYTWVVVSSIPLFLDMHDRPYQVFSTFLDITERKKSEDALKESEEKFKSLFHNHAAVKLIIDTDDGNIADANEAAVLFYGWSREELCKMKISQINTLSPEKLKEAIEKALNSKNTVFEFSHRKADGTVVDVEVFSSKINIGGKEYLHSIIHDITERKKFEKQFLHIQKMESVGRLAGGVAHDFNNIITVIQNYSEMAMKELGMENPVYEDLKEIYDAAMRSSRITKQLLAFARKQEIKPCRLALNVTIENMLKMLSRLIGEEIELEWKPGQGLWEIIADPSQIDQVLANLCVNARDAIAGVGKVIIETENAVLEENYAALHPGFAAGEYVLLSVSDDGCGMDRETVSQIFEPFYTTKKAGEGTGLGLSTVYGIVRQNNGFINVSSEPGKGTTFKIYLPRSSGAAATADREPGKTDIKGNGETILVVEDEAAILAVAKKILINHGYNVIGTTSPITALELAKEHGCTIKLLLTDVVMPEMNGRELALKLSEICPEMKILYMSGYTENETSKKGMPVDGINYIQKPFSSESLAFMVWDLIKKTGLPGRNFS